MRIINHQSALEYLVNNIEIINIDLKKVNWILREPTIYLLNSKNMAKSCDIVVGYYNQTADLIELKHSYDQINKALTQINETDRYLLKSIDYRLNNKYIVFYPFFNYETY